MATGGWLVVMAGAFVGLSAPQAAAQNSRIATVRAEIAAETDDETSAESAEDVGARTGVVEGTVSYATDAKRPWRYSRYYVKRVSSGELAEAVVALRGRSLKSAAEREAKTVVVDQQNFQFTPETVAIQVGDSVKFTNSDGATHNVQSTSEIAEFNVTMPTGGSHTVKFGRAGGTRQFVRIGCVFHSAMQSFVFVFDHPHYHVTSSNGKFRLEGVPPGEYELEMVHPAGMLRTRQKVEVVAGETRRADIRVGPDNKF